MMYLIFVVSFIVAVSIGLGVAYIIGEYNYSEFEDPLDEAEANVPRLKYPVIRRPKAYVHKCRNKSIVDDTDMESGC